MKTKFAMFLIENYIMISITLGVFLGLLITFNCMTIHKEDGKYVVESSMGPWYERAEFGKDGYVGKLIVDGNEVYTLTIG